MVRTRPPKKQQVVRSEDREYSKKKIQYFIRANALFDEYNKILVVVCDNVQSKQIQDIRTALRGKAEVLNGKNTTIRKVLRDRAARGDPRDVKLLQGLVGEGLLRFNIGLILTNGEVSEIRDIIEKNKVQAPARMGSIAPLDVFVPAGNTGMEPTKTSFFQALNINTKITKGTVEILKDEHLIKKGDKVGSSEATLLQMLDIKPFFYGLELTYLYDNGTVFSKEVLEMNEEDKRNMFATGISTLTALSLGLGFTTKASLPHTVMDGFKRLLAVSLGTNFLFSKGEEIVKAIKEGKSLGPAAASAPAASASPAKEAPAAKKEEPKKAEEEEEDGDMGFGLFD